MNKYLKLCYIDENWAYFTSQDIDKQWGDDWDDAPYEHNANEPYTSDEGLWTILKIAFDGPFSTPIDMSGDYSVEAINAKQVPWLKTHEWNDCHAEIFAGTNVEEFEKIVESVGGHVYYPKTYSSE